MRATSHSTIGAPTASARTRGRATAALRRTVPLALIALLVALPALAETHRIVIRVNDRIATLYDYEQARQDLVQALTRAELPPERLQERLADVGVEVMSDLLEEMLLLSRADQLETRISREEIDQAVQRAKDASGIEDDGEFEQALASSGFTLESFREHMEKNLTMQTVMGQEVRPRIRLSEEDLRRYYQQHLEDYQVPTQLKVREFVVLESATSSAEDRAAIARDIRERLLAGEPAEEVVASYADKGLTTSWIDLDWVVPGDLDPELEAAIWELDAAELSEPVPARGGLHVCQVVERREATVQEFTEVADQIEQQETNRRFQSEIGEYLAELERNSHVVINPPPEAASFRTVLERRREEGLEIDERGTALATAGLEVTQPAEPDDDPEEPPGQP